MKLKPPSTLTLRFAAAVGIVVLLLVAVLVMQNTSRFTHSQKKLPTPESGLNWQANPASPITVRFDDTVASKALRNGLTHLEGRIREIPPYERLILDYLQRKFGLDQRFSASKTPIQEPKPGQHEDKATFLTIRRIAYPGSIVSKLPDTTGDPMSEMTLAAFNCDHIPLSDSFRMLVGQNLAAGGYELTHVEFSLQRLQENGCEYFSPQELQDINFRLTEGLVALSANPDTPVDLRNEALAFLLDIDGEARVQQTWIDQIIAAQRADGGWRQEEAIGPSSDHTTMLAVWALLIWTHQPATNEPMIHPPGS